MSHNCKLPAFIYYALLLNETVPFVITIVATVLFSMYLLLDPAEGLAEFMQLTYLSLDFKGFMLFIAAVGFACAYVAERRGFPWLAKAVGKVHDWAWPHRRKKRKEYKLLSERMRI